METARRRHSSEFKAKVALEAVIWQKTLNELVTEFGVHPVRIAQWMRHLVDASPATFEGGVTSSRKERAQGALIEQLYQQIGHLKVEVDRLMWRASWHARHSICRALAGPASTLLLEKWRNAQNFCSTVSRHCNTHWIT